MSLSSSAQTLTCRLERLLGTEQSVQPAELGEPIGQRVQRRRRQPRGGKRQSMTLKDRGVRRERSGPGGRVVDPRHGQVDGRRQRGVDQWRLLGGKLGERPGDLGLQVDRGLEAGPEPPAGILLDPIDERLLAWLDLDSLLDEH
jgi:hypothetical protein